MLVSYRTGDMWAPRMEQLEALHVELDSFADCITNSKTPFNDGHAGLRVVRMLEAAERSIQQARGAGTTVNEFCSIAPDVKLGKGRRLSKFINLYGCEIRATKPKSARSSRSRRTHRWGAAAKSRATPLFAKA